MPKVTIEKSTTSSAAETFSKVKKLLTDDKDLKKLDSDFSCIFDDKNLTGKASGKMFKADLKVSGTERGSEVQIVVDLPLAFALAKGLVQKTLDAKLTEVLS